MALGHSRRELLRGWGAGKRFGQASRGDRRGTGLVTSGLNGRAEFGAPETAPRSRAFARARNHSRRVRFFKRAIPLGATLGVVAIGLATWFNPFRNIEGLTVGPVSVSGTHVTMESPRLTGFRNDSRPYEVTASSALQDVRRPNIVELKDLRARIVTDDQGGAP